MRVLAVDTSTLLGGIAVIDESGLVVEINLTVKTAHSERLMGALDLALRQSGLKISDIDVLAVAIGPGSFTGLRIGLSTIKGFSYATGRQVVTVPSLEALAWNFPMSRYPVCTMFDARKKEVYAALFVWEGEGFGRLISETSIKPDAFIREHLLRTGHGKIVFAGEGAILYRDIIEKSMGITAFFAPPHLMSPSAKNAAYLGLRKALTGQFSDPAKISPFYIRKSEAELKLR